MDGELEPSLSLFKSGHSLDYYLNKFTNIKDSTAKLKNAISSKATKEGSSGGGDSQLDKDEEGLNEKEEKEDTAYGLSNKMVNRNEIHPMGLAFKLANASKAINEVFIEELNKYAGKKPVLMWSDSVGKYSQDFDTEEDEQVKKLEVTKQ